MTHVSAQLRLLIPSDIDAVMAIETVAHSHPWKRQSMDDSLAGHHRCVGCVVNEELVGFYIASMGGGDAELLDIAIHPSQRGRGLADLLMGDLIQWAEKKAETVFLEVRISNHKAISVYQRHDFIEVGERPNYYPTANGKEHALIMARYLR
ncbi:ribosomal protein S18-alanine N-acetyltransferase [Simiduia aestuariiviva]|uniref:[Ribosomal protein bS18]-alanine N-acetyltransferase n=1 Tax=Simiduia aestuariiviva TaxID=1510459 RepID=A0A839USM9_9GAMM|nr:ribosomal protein S18-alanine N-acetyltransferase [Simiduia aestuariiviva]MBB3169470.1 ribosomal-protein-alanine N-acetyltransferase [Simiduia aestuariiviva]